MSHITPETVGLVVKGMLEWPAIKKIIKWYNRFSKWTCSLTEDQVVAGVLAFTTWTAIATILAIWKIIDIIIWIARQWI